MKSFILSALFTSAYALDWANITSGATSADKACQVLHKKFPNATFGTGQEEYTSDNTNFWSKASIQDPACVFAPSKPEDLGVAVNVLRRYKTPFAVRGGGHMPIGSANAINSSGILISSSGFTQLELSADKKSVHIGPSNHWNAVYRYLEPYGLTVVGGRLGVVGVPGFVTGGGISFFSNQHGWASANVASYTVVLADGSVVKASPKSHQDLYWALRGGGNSFGIVTDLELLTYSAPVVTVGQTSYNTTKDKFLGAIHDFAANTTALDDKAALIPIAGLNKNGSITYSAMRFYDGNNTKPVAFTNFTAPYQQVLNDTFSPRTMSQWNKELDPVFGPLIGNVRTRFYIVSLFLDLRGMHIVHDTWYGGIERGLASIPQYTSGVAFMPIGKQYFKASKVHGGDPMNIDPASGPHIWVELSMTWVGDAETENTMTNFMKAMDVQIKANLKAAGVSENPFLYLNDADEWQDVWAGYPKSSIVRLKAIRKKYDPSGLFTYQMPGGWKVEKAAC